MYVPLGKIQGPCVYYYVAHTVLASHDRVVPVSNQAVFLTADKRDVEGIGLSGGALVVAIVLF